MLSLLRMLHVLMVLRAFYVSCMVLGICWRLDHAVSLHVRCDTQFIILVSAMVMF